MGNEGIIEKLHRVPVVTPPGYGMPSLIVYHFPGPDIFPAPGKELINLRRRGAKPSILNCFPT